MQSSGQEEFEAGVARADPDRFVASLFAPRAARGDLIALYAFNLEIGRIREAVHEPLAGHIRLGWWREQLDAIYSGRAPGVPLAIALGRAVKAHDLPRDLLDDYLNARVLDLQEAPFADEAEMEAHAVATSAGLMQLAARALGAGAAADDAARPAGIAYAYAGNLRSLAFHAAGRHCRLPRSWLEAEGINADDVFAGTGGEGLVRVRARLREAAARHLALARKGGVSPRAMPALAPARMVSAYLADQTPSAFARLRRVAWGVLSGHL